MVNNVFVSDGYNSFIGDDGVRRQLDNATCIPHSYFDLDVNCVIGTPKNIPCKNRWGQKGQLNLINFATKIDAERICRIFPNEIRTEVTTTYDAYDDAILVSTTKYFRTLEIEKKWSTDHNHPDYERLKAEYEAEQARLEAERARLEALRNSYLFNSPISSTTKVDNRQKSVTIDGKSFEVVYPWSDTAYVTLDDETLFSTDVKTVNLDNGQKVFFKTFNHGHIAEQENIVALRNMVINAELMRIRKNLKAEYARIQVCTIEDVFKNSKKIGAVELMKGYKDEPLYGYGYISLKKNTVSFELSDNEEKANEKTQEALQHLFQKQVNKLYPDGKFSAQKGKKKKTLTPEESKMKMEFNSVVKELLLDLSIDNAQENLEFLDEYFLDITEGLQKAS